MIPFIILGGMSKPTGGEYSKPFVIVVRILTTTLATVCLGLAVFEPTDWHRNFPQDGWLNTGALFSGIFLCLGFISLAYGYGLCRIRQERTK